MVALRVSLGVIWATNLIFIADPANRFFSSFAATANSYAPSSLGGSGFPAFVAANPGFFAGLIAAVTLYLTLAFLLGLTTRLACVVGAAFAVVLLVSQFGTTFVIPGGTDVGPMPIYLAGYVALLIGRSDRQWSLDLWLSRRPFRWRLTVPSRRPGPH
jgi:uncharacterized membrane protein YphA (DoxX/SURF4 family)